MKTVLTLSTLAVLLICAGPAAATGGGPTRYGPSYPYPTYCEACLGRAEFSPRPVVAPRRHEEHRRGRAHASGELPKS